jgi:HK97 family phage prohead protease
MGREVERRTWGTIGAVAVRADEDAKKKPPLISGYAAVFGVLSDDLGGFREMVMPGAFDRALREGHDVRALINHNPDLVLGRTKAGTLRLAIDEHGLKSEIEPPDTQTARDLLVSIERGDVSQMSFAFQTLTDEWRLEEGEVIRELVDLVLYDVSPVAFAAYPQTVVASRALDRAKLMVEEVLPVKAFGREPGRPIALAEAQQRMIDL